MVSFWRVSCDTTFSTFCLCTGCVGWLVFLSEVPEDKGRSLITVVLTGSFVFEVVAVAGRLTSCVFSALGFGMVEAVAGRSWGRVAPVVADPSAFRCACLASCAF
nr:hypothetical protein BN167_220031 [Clostridioides difficile E13]